MRKAIPFLLCFCAVLSTQLFQKAMAQYWSLSGNNNSDSRTLYKLGTTNGAPLRIYTNNTERMRIDTAGGVGINPPATATGLFSSRFQVYSPSSQNPLRVIVGGTTKFLVSSGGGVSIGSGSTPPANGLYVSGNVGIGTSTPATRFSVNLGTTTGDAYELTNGTIAVRTHIGGNYGQVGTYSNHAFQLMANNGYNQFVLMPNGVVGIGTGTASKAGLTVDKKMGAVNAMFGSNTTGVAIESAWPGVALNTYWDGSTRRFISSGFGGLLGLDPTNGTLAIYTSKVSGSSNATASVYANLAITAAGNVGIGTSTPTYKLDVCGVLRAKEILVQTGWCDYVFENDYKLRPLHEVEAFVKENKHLPDVPAAKEIESNGVPVAQMDSIFIKKIEELTLYVIDQNKQIQQLQQKLDRLEKSDADKKNQ